MTKIRGIDLHTEALAEAERTRIGLGLTNVTFEEANVSDVEIGTFDAALLLDIIEHLEDEAPLLHALGQAIRPEGTLLISTPTPNFPRMFGREFHEAVGHVRDGYSVEDVRALLAPFGFEVIQSSYYTRLPSALCCALYYRFLWKNKLGLILSPFLNALSLLDGVWPWSAGSCSILVLARKV